MKNKVNPVTARQAFEEACTHGRVMRWDSYSPKLKPTTGGSVGVTLATDLHYGVNIDEAEVPGNQVDRRTMARRTAFLTARRLDYKQGKRQGSRVLLGGDIIEGEIHGRGTNAPLAQQVFDAQWCLHHMINANLAAFGSVHVDCATGNHDRWAHRGPGRVVDGKWDSLSTLVYAWLAGVHRNNPRVTFSIPKTPYTVWKAPGGQVCVLTHGDTVYYIGNPASSISYSKARSQTNSLSKVTKRTHGGDVELVCLGHHHSPAIFQIDDFTVAVNGCLSGISQYSQSLGYHVGKPRQLIFEQTTEHVMGHPEFCDVSGGDSDKEMDKLVPTPPDVAT